MEIIFSNNSKKQLTKLNVRLQQKILSTLEKFKNNQPVDMIKLKNKNEEFRIRTGNYRIQLQKVKEGFLITKIGKRENFYLVFF
ncbi:type II toxin-antitoxin system mRNA interferase toxin, RelE/StbE family [Candidatus Pacearchaeota archaeon]|jgi:mRNA-degrading endonuclease RelE of RelBE toxin-antitoxin system|nr:type II toxin-antitoxin system mRNA interferase toxin, RelE/StbE family [Candidatus Pacearchaeota archaeon]|tara:strand:- start:982 stop:1233 length:252 start_codon:yes stop_codon:yes gene_type:complete